MCEFWNDHREDGVRQIHAGAGLGWVLGAAPQRLDEADPPIASQLTRGSYSTRIIRHAGIILVCLHPGLMASCLAFDGLASADVAKQEDAPSKDGRISVCIHGTRHRSRIHGSLCATQRLRGPEVVLNTPRSQSSQCSAIASRGPCESKAHRAANYKLEAGGNHSSVLQRRFLKFSVLLYARGFVGHLPGVSHFPPSSRSSSRLGSARCSRWSCGTWRRCGTPPRT